VGTTDGWGRAVNGGGKSVACGRASGRWAAWVVSEAEARARGREGGNLGLNRPSREGRVVFFFFPFSFLFSFS
jgi:hypothetical protein